MVMKWSIIIIIPLHITALCVCWHMLALHVHLYHGHDSSQHSKLRSICKNKPNSMNGSTSTRRSTAQEQTVTANDMRHRRGATMEYVT
jgi:hypothetical protein